MGIAIIGTGAIAEIHASALTESGVELVAVSGVDEDQRAKFAERFDIRLQCGSHMDLLASDAISSVIIATPSQFHADFTLEAIRHGKSVLCEVPLALDWDSFESVERASRESEVVVAIAQTLRYSSPHLMLKQILTENPPSSLNILVRNLMFRQENIGWTGVKRTWVDSVVWHHGSHSFDLAAWLLSDQVTRAHVQFGPEWSNGQVMECNGILETAHGHSATVSLSYHSRISHNDVVVITESATYEISQGRLSRNGEAVFSTVNPEDVFLDAVKRQNLAFLRAVADGDRTDVVTPQQLTSVHEWLAQR